MIYKNPCGNLVTPKNLLNGEPKYNFSPTTAISLIPVIFPFISYQLDIILPFSSTFIIEIRGLINV